MEQRTAVITGGNKGIGAVISRAFHGAGFKVVIGARSDNGLARELGGRALFHPVDVASPEGLRGLVRAALDWSGRLDVLINNAGMSGWRPLDKVDETFWQKMLDVNLKGVLFGCQAAAPHLPPGGAIVNISSMAGKRGTASNAVYCAAKFGVNGVTQALAKELGPRGIRVNALCPVLIRTEGLVEALQEEYSPARAKGVDRFLEEFTSANAALGRLPTAADVAEFCLFLSSDKAAAITGQCINVDCGVFPQ